MKTLLYNLKTIFIIIALLVSSMLVLALMIFGEGPGVLGGLLISGVVLIIMAALK